jgi:hypothetical protein
MFSTRKAALACYAIVALSLISLGIGIALMTMLGGQDGSQLGQSASGADWASAVPLLTLAELVKFALAAAQVIVVTHLATRTGPALGALLRAAGYSGALLVALSGIAGLQAIVAQNPMPSLPSLFGFLGLAATGLWALLLLVAKALQTPRWHRMLTLPFGLLGIAVPLFAPASFAAALLGLAWWAGLGRHLAAEAQAGSPPSD